jgi:hypothetical protein
MQPRRAGSYRWIIRRPCQWSITGESLNGPDSADLRCAQSRQLIQGPSGQKVFSAMNILPPVDVLDSFADQPATLKMQPTVVLFGDARHAPLAHDADIRHQRSE